MREPDPEPTSAPTSAFVPREEEAPHRSWKPREKQNKRWLYPTQIDDVYSNCFSDPISNSKVERVYSNGNNIVVQCATYGIEPEEDQ